MYNFENNKIIDIEMTAHKNGADERDGRILNNILDDFYSQYEEIIDAIYDGEEITDLIDTDSKTLIENFIYYFENEK